MTLQRHLPSTGGQLVTAMSPSDWWTICGSASAFVPATLRLVGRGVEVITDALSGRAREQESRSGVRETHIGSPRFRVARVLAKLCEDVARLGRL